MAASGQCVVIELNSEDPVRMAKVLRQAWMEGGIKRGLEGLVIIPDDSAADPVQIVAQGKPERVQAFADWCGRELARDGESNASVRTVDECPTVPLSIKFQLANMPRGKAKCAPGGQIGREFVWDIPISYVAGLFGARPDPAFPRAARRGRSCSIAPISTPPASRPPTTPPTRGARDRCRIAVAVDGLSPSLGRHSCTALRAQT